jgi:hypothetical protein
VKKILLILLSVIFLSGCELPPHDTGTVKTDVTTEKLTVVKDSQQKDRLGEYQKFYIAPFKGGDAIVSAGTPKGLEGGSLAIYWPDANGQSCAINDRAKKISPEILRYQQLPIEINPAELLAAVKEKY